MSLWAWNRWSLLGPLLALAGGLLFLSTTSQLQQTERAVKPWDPDLSVVLPAPVAAVMAGGDPYLAANMQVIRGLVVSTHLDSPEQKALFARLLTNASELNPAHEDGYYLAQALLPWNGYVEENQAIQAAAGEARPWDWLPVFFQAFNRYYFLKEPGPASDILRQAAERASPKNRPALLANAARWRAAGRDPQQALRVIRAMLAAHPSGPLNRELQARETQLQGLLRLREAAAAYRQQRGGSPSSVADLVGHAGLERVPRDPFGEGYVINEAGRVVVTPPKPLRQKPQLPAQMR
ncbi:MAG TPA: hypothetical protein VJ985_09825 [Gammaproteobacteria bacterium]|nr:hypothetical protein [Gammaproteobacteria bacterium]